ncbi:bis(5'-nucleosyl)-tetraphosphatase (symmetrical) YqeK [bacterium]|nr:bis(5'-nucleosyl)-tetraphosphatase (symmetrical) YqeK [bacterium]
MNFEKLEKEILVELNKRLSKKRVEHILSVSKSAYELALYYQLDAKRHNILALLHDLCKEAKRGEQKAIIQKHFPNDKVLINTPALYHSKSSYIEAHTLFSLSSEFLSPIQWHTTGKSKMTLDDKVLYIADYIEELRPWHDPAFMDQAKNDIDQLLLKILTHKIEYTMSGRKQVHPDSLDCYNDLVSGAN